MFDETIHFSAQLGQDRKQDDRLEKKYTISKPCTEISQPHRESILRQEKSDRVKDKDGDGDNDTQANEASQVEIESLVGQLQLGDGVVFCFERSVLGLFLPVNLILPLVNESVTA